MKIYGETARTNAAAVAAGNRNNKIMKNIKMNDVNKEWVSLLIWCGKNHKYCFDLAAISLAHTQPLTADHGWLDKTTDYPQYARELARNLSPQLHSFFLIACDHCATTSMKCSLLDWHRRRVNRRLLGVRVRHMKQLQMNEIEWIAWVKAVVKKNANCIHPRRGSRFECVKWNTGVSFNRNFTIAVCRCCITCHPMRCDLWCRLISFERSHLPVGHRYFSFIYYSFRMRLTPSIPAGCVPFEKFNRDYTFLSVLLSNRFDAREN